GLEDAGIRAVVAEVVVDDAGAARVGEELRAVADEAARRDGVLHARAAAAGRAHVAHATAAATELLDDGAGVGLVDVDDRVLVGLQLLPLGAALEDDLRL